MVSELTRRFPLATVYNIKDYGALTAASDNRVAIQAAIDAAYNAGGGRVFIPAGTFLLDPNPGLQVKSNVTLFGTGKGSILKLINGSTRNDNIVKSESWEGVSMHDFTVDGNRTNQAGSPGAYTYTQYAIYIADTTGEFYNLWIRSTTGVGFHTYNCSDGLQAHDIWSDDHNYHSFEIEQCVGANYVNLYTPGSLRHALLVSPGEVGGTGSKFNKFTNCYFGGSGQYGIAFDAAVGDVSAWLSEGNVFTNCTVVGNDEYGVSIYKQDKQIFNNLVVANNGFFGIYLFQSQGNMFNNFFMHNNSQTTNNAYDEIMIEGYTSNNSHPSILNLFTMGTILIDGANKARYAINEANSNDGSNTFVDIAIPSAGATGRYNIQSTASVLSSRTIGLGIAANATLNGNQMGVDAPFGTAALRMFNGNAGGNLQFVSPNGNSDWYAGGNNTFSVTATQAIAQNKLLALAGSSSSYAKVGGTLFAYNSDTGNSGTSETDLYTDTVAANTLSTNKDALEARYAGEMVNSATATRQLKVYFAGTAIFDTGALSLSASSDWDMEVLIVRVSASVVRYSVKLNLTGASLSAYANVGELTGLTLSNGNVLKITGQAAGVGAATNDIVAKLGTVEWRSAP